VHVGSADASESGMRAAKNCVGGGIELKTSALISFYAAPPLSVQP
jgi:hypothetical protein